MSGRCLKGVWFQECFKDHSRMFQESLRVFQGSLKVVSRKFQGYFEGVLRVFQVCCNSFEEVSRAV